MGLGVGVRFGRIPTNRAGVTRWTNLVEEMQTNRTSQLLLFLPVFLTAPIFAFVCGFLLHSAVG